MDFSASCVLDDNGSDAKESVAKNCFVFCFLLLVLLSEDTDFDDSSDAGVSSAAGRLFLR